VNRSCVARSVLGRADQRPIDDGSAHHGSTARGAQHSSRLQECNWWVDHASQFKMVDRALGLFARVRPARHTPARRLRHCAAEAPQRSPAGEKTAWQPRRAAVWLPRREALPPGQCATWPRPVPNQWPRPLLRGWGWTCDLSGCAVCKPKQPTRINRSVRSFQTVSGCQSSLESMLEK